MSPIAFTGSGDFIARYGDGFSFGETREIDDDIVFVIFGSYYFYVRNFILLGCSVEDYRCLVFGALCENGSSGA